MEQYSLQDAQNQLKRLLDDAQHGKTILILDDNNQAVQLVPINTRKSRKAGSARGQIKLSDDFDAPIFDK